MTALLTREGVDDEMGRANQACLHGGGGLDRDEFIHKRLIDATAKFTEGLREHKMGLGLVGLVRANLFRNFFNRGCTRREPRRSGFDNGLLGLSG